MAVNVENEPGVILHSRPYTDSKKIISVLTPHYGRVSLVARQAKKSASAKPFTVLLLSWTGKSELKTLCQYEELETARLTQGRPLFCGMYLNELCSRLLPELQAQEQVYENYLETIKKLSGTGDDLNLMEVLLRRFEFSLLDSLGLGINFDRCVEGQEIVSEDAFYAYEIEQGFRRCLQSDEAREGGVELIPARHLAKIREQDWSADTLKSAKKLSRLALKPLLGERPLKSRELFT